MFNEKIFSHAVTIAAAFVANGDIRCGSVTRKNSTAMAQVHALVVSLCAVLQDARMMAEEQTGKEANKPPDHPDR